MSAPQPNAPVEPTLLPTVVSEPISSSGTESLVSTASASGANSQITTPSEPLSDAIPIRDNVPASWLWLTKHDQTFVAFCVAVFLTLTGYHWAKLGGWGMVPIEVDRLPARQYDFRIDINSACWVEWTQIEGIGEATAQKIIADRDSNGPFRSIKELLRVKGIGPKTLEKMRPYLRGPNEDRDARKTEP